MINKASIKDRGTTPRKLATAVRQAKKRVWPRVGVLFHEEMRPLRFTHKHAREAGYAKRKGDGLARGSTAWNRSTAGQKFRKSKSVHGADQPLVFSGRTRSLTEMASVTATSKGVKVRYSGANTLNFRHPKSRVDMRREFLTLTKREINRLAKHFDNELDRELSNLG